MDEDFEVVRLTWAAAGRLDEGGVAQNLHPEIVAVPFGAAMENRAYRGPAEVMSWWQTRSSRTGSPSRCSPRASNGLETGS